MRKEYVKPQLYFETYVPNTHIATCFWDLRVNNTDIHNCGATSFDDGGDPDLIIYTNNNCTVDPGIIEDYCYENGAGGKNLFNS